LGEYDCYHDNKRGEEVSEIYWGGVSGWILVESTVQSGMDSTDFLKKKIQRKLFGTFPGNVVKVGERVVGGDRVMAPK